MLGRYAVKQWNAKTVAVIDDRTAYGEGIAEELVKSATAAGAKVVSRQYTNDKATDFHGILTQAKRASPMTAKFMGGDGICTGELPSLSGLRAVPTAVVEAPTVS